MLLEEFTDSFTYVRMKKGNKEKKKQPSEEVVSFSMKIVNNQYYLTGQ